MTADRGHGFYDYFSSGVSLDFSVYRYFVKVVYSGPITLSYRLFSGELEETAFEAVERYDPPTKAELDTMESAIRGADDDTLETLSDQIDRVNGGDGSRTVTITVQDGDAAAVSGARVEVWNAGNDSYITMRTTDENGQCTGDNAFHLDDGTYTVRLIKTGVSFSIESLTVSGDTDTTYTGTLLTALIGTPESPSQTRVYMWCFSLDDETAPESVTATARIVTLPYVYNGNHHIGSTVTGVYDDDSESGTYGLLYWDMVKGAAVYLDIPDFGIRKTITVPTETPAHVDDL